MSPNLQLLHSKLTTQDQKWDFAWWIFDAGKWFLCENGTRTRRRGSSVKCYGESQMCLCYGWPVLQAWLIPPLASADPAVWRVSVGGNVPVEGPAKPPVGLLMSSKKKRVPTFVLIFPHTFHFLGDYLWLRWPSNEYQLANLFRLTSCCNGLVWSVLPLTWDKKMPPALLFQLASAFGRLHDFRLRIGMWSDFCMKFRVGGGRCMRMCFVILSQCLTKKDKTKVLWRFCSARKFIELLFFGVKFSQHNFCDISLPSVFKRPVSHLRTWEASWRHLRKKGGWLYKVPRLCNSCQFSCFKFITVMTVVRPVWVLRFLFENAEACPCASFFFSHVVTYLFLMYTCGFSPVIKRPVRLFLQSAAKWHRRKRECRISFLSCWVCVWWVTFSALLLLAHRLHPPPAHGGYGHQDTAHVAALERKLHWPWWVLFFSGRAKPAQPYGVIYEWSVWTRGGGPPPPPPHTPPKKQNRPTPKRRHKM